MTSTETAPQASGAGAPARVPALRNPAAPTRRRPALIGLGVALVAATALTAGWLVQTASATTSVVAVAEDVTAGSILTADDLKTVNINLDSGLDTIPARQLSALVGQHAVVSMLTGQTLTSSAVAPDLVPPEGKALVGVTLSPGQAPAHDFAAGDRVLIVDTPAGQGDPPTTTPASIEATVVNTELVPDTDKTVVNVAVRADKAADLAARVATGRIAIVLTPLQPAPTR